MNIWLYNFPTFLSNRLNGGRHSLHFVRSISKFPEYMQDEDALFCLWAGPSELEMLSNLKNTQFVYPSKTLLVNLFSSRIAMTKQVDVITAYPAERDYVQSSGFFNAIVPKFSNSFQVVAKTGEEHRGDGKFLLYPGQQIQAKDSLIFEEFLPEAQSVRVLIIGKEVFVIEYHDDPDNPKIANQNWIKNINPKLRLVENMNSYQGIITDALNIANRIGFDYLGVDYVMNNEKTVCLEINPFPGFSFDPIKYAATKYWQQKIEQR